MIPAILISGKSCSQGNLPDAQQWSLVHGLASLLLSGRIQARTGDGDPEALARAVTELFVDRMLRRSLR